MTGPGMEPAGGTEATAGPVLTRSRADDPVALALLADYEAELVDQGIVLHRGEGGSVEVEEMSSRWGSRLRPWLPLDS